MQEGALLHINGDAPRFFGPQGPQHKVRYPNSGDGCKASPMTENKRVVCTWGDSSVLETLLFSHEPIEIIDIRPKAEFAAMHIRGAQSLPFRELTMPGLFRRIHATAKPICVISAGSDAQASLAVGILRSAGCVNAIALRGGMKDWIARGLPVWRREFGGKLRAYVARAIFVIMAAVAAALLHQVVVSGLLLTIAVVLVIGAAISGRGRRPKHQPLVLQEAS